MILEQQLPRSRPQRLRKSPALRALIKETDLNLNDFVMPLFIKDALTCKHPIPSMPGQFQLPLSSLEREIDEILEFGINAILLFGIPSSKDPYGRASYHEEGIIQRALQIIKGYSKELFVICDLCLCEYTDHGHCGILDSNFHIDNDATLQLLIKQALSFAKEGADMIAPSGMIDGGVRGIRDALDEAGFSLLPIMSYSAKYASSFYAPFREAAEGAPSFGDRRSHQMDYSNSNEALKEVSLDIQEGADIIMIKPAHTYLDVIYKVKKAYPHIPLAAYHTSGEYSMIKAAAQMGWIDEKASFHEVLTSIKRAGADIIISYFAKEFAKNLLQNG